VIENIKKDFIQGLKTFKFWASVISERIKVEINVLKLIGQINSLMEKREELLKRIGEEISETWNTDFNLKENEKISYLIRQIKELDLEIEEKKKKLADLEEIGRWKS